MCCLCCFFDCFLRGGSGGLNGLCNRAGLRLDISRINNTAYLNHTAKRLLRCLDLHLLVLAFRHRGRVRGRWAFNWTCQTDVSKRTRVERMRVCVPKKIAGPTTKPYFPRVNGRHICDLLGKFIGRPLRISIMFIVFIVSNRRDCDTT